MIGSNVGSTGDATYVYDGEGRRLQKIASPYTTTYVYDAAEQMVAEYSNQPSTVSGTQYLTDDHLGSTRLVMTSSDVHRYDYLPFGEEIPQGTSGRGSEYPVAVTMYPATPDKVNTRLRRTK